MIVTNQDLLGNI